MRIDYNGHIIHIWDSIEELPILRYSSFQNYLLIDANIGSDMESINERISVMQRYIASKNLDKLNKEFTNFRQSLVFIISGINPKYMSFASFVKSIDGKSYSNELSIDEVEDIINTLGKIGMPFNKLKYYLNKVKKKLDQEFELYFPSISKDIHMIEYYTKLKKRCQLIINKIVTGDDLDKDIEKLEKSLFDDFEPKVFGGSDGVEVRNINAFTDTNLSLTQLFNKDPESLTTYKYYRLMGVVKEQNKKK